MAMILNEMLEEFITKFLYRSNVEYKAIEANYDELLLNTKSRWAKTGIGYNSRTRNDENNEILDLPQK